MTPEDGNLLPAIRIPDARSFAFNDECGLAANRAKATYRRIHAARNQNLRAREELAIRRRRDRTKHGHARGVSQRRVPAGASAARTSVTTHGDP